MDLEEDTCAVISLQQPVACTHPTHKSTHASRKNPMHQQWLYWAFRCSWTLLAIAWRIQWMLCHKAGSVFAQQMQLINQVDTFKYDWWETRGTEKERTMTSTYVSVPKVVRKAKQWQEEKWWWRQYSSPSRVEDLKFLIGLFWISISQEWKA